MSAPITAAESIKIYELLNVINDTQADIHNGYAIMLAVSNLSVKTAVDEKIAALDNAQIDRVRELLAEYDNLAFDTSELQNATLGNMTGINYSAQKAIYNLGVLLHTNIPVMTYARSLLRKDDQNQLQSQAAPSRGSGISFNRG